ncbi:MAG TPA: hypothetical protein VF159_03275 [Gemmatimonadaceae bacterium]
MTRLIIFLLTLAVLAVVTTICIYVLGSKPSAAVLGALAGVLGALVVNGIVAIVKRGGEDA